MQLRTRLLTPLAALAALLCATSSGAQVATFDTTHSLFHEAPTRSNMTVYTPSTDLEVTPWEFLSLRAGWEADVVSGASVAVKAGPTYQTVHPGADVVTTASVHDLRNSARGGFTLRKDIVSFTGGYNYSTENDYRSNSFNVAARTEPLQHDTQLEAAYAHNFDDVCNRVQTAGNPATLSRALEDSTGCFTSSATRTKDAISVDSLQGSWSQAWTPVFVTQLVYTGQILNGFQSDPYRSVVLADGVKAQEHVPDNRAREALALRTNWFLKPVKAAVRVGVRAYTDSWNIRSGDVTAEFEKYFGDSFRATLRGRIYKQTGAVFWSDDYTGGAPPLGPRGQYWTGDRELSPFTSYAVGLRAIYSVTPTNGRIAGFISGLRFGGTADLIQFDYSQFTLAGIPLANTRAWIFGLNASISFF